VNGRERKARKETRSESAGRTASQEREIRVTRMTKEVIPSDGGGAAARESEETKKRAIDFEDPVFSHCSPEASDDYIHRPARQPPKPLSKQTEGGFPPP